MAKKTYNYREFQKQINEIPSEVSELITNDSYWKDRWRLFAFCKQYKFNPKIIPYKVMDELANDPVYASEFMKQTKGLNFAPNLIPPPLRLMAQMVDLRAHVAVMSVRIAALTEQVAGLLAQVARLSKNSSNSSKPLSSDIVKPPPPPLPPG